MAWISWPCSKLMQLRVGFLRFINRIYHIWLDLHVICLFQTSIFPCWDGRIQCLLRCFFTACKMASQFLGEASGSVSNVAVNDFVFVGNAVSPWENEIVNNVGFLKFGFWGKGYHGWYIYIYIYIYIYVRVCVCARVRVHLPIPPNMQDVT